MEESLSADFPARIKTVWDTLSPLKGSFSILVCSGPLPRKNNGAPRSLSWFNRIRIQSQQKLAHTKPVIQSRFSYREWPLAPATPSRRDWLSFGFWGTLGVVCFFSPSALIQLLSSLIHLKVQITNKHAKCTSFKKVYFKKSQYLKSNTLYLGTTLKYQHI